MPQLMCLEAKSCFQCTARCAIKRIVYNLRGTLILGELEHAELSTADEFHYGLKHLVPTTYLAQLGSCS